MNKVLFVCQANVGRSQMAETLYNFHTGTVNATSAGVEDYREKYHHRPTLEIIKTMKEKGMDISNQRIDVISPELIEQSDLIVVLCAKALCPDFLTESPKAFFWEVEDPHQLDVNSIRLIRDQIEQIVLKLIGK